MAYKVLYRKYRPDDFNNVVGQEYTVGMLKNAISSGKNAHAYIFTGPRGTGKTSSAKVFAKALNCEHPVDGNPCNECTSCLNFKENPDIIEIDAASNNGVDEIRELINNVKLVPTSSKYKIYIIDEVHMLTASAFNALLLTLEEPPAHVVFILATTDIQNVPITILSRCQRFDFKPINKDIIVKRLRYICDEENINITDEALGEIALISAGGMRDALGMLDQLSNEDSEITIDVVSNYFGSISHKTILELLTSISENNHDSFSNVLGNIKTSGTNYSVFVEKLIIELRDLAVQLKTGKYDMNFEFGDIYNMIFDLNECLCNININVDPYILIEIVLMKYMGNLGNTNVNVMNGFGYSNNFSSNSSQNSYDNSVKTSSISNTGNTSNNDNISISGTTNVKKSQSKKSEVIHKQVAKKESKVDEMIRINNCFVEANKDSKKRVMDNWIDFMNSLMNKDRNLVSMLADTSILAASDSYVLIQSKIATTNDLINQNIDVLEKEYSNYSGLDCKFAAINDELWKKEVEKYRFNLKNQIKYSYMEEKNIVSTDTNETNSSDIESVAKDIFGSYEVE